MAWSQLFKSRRLFLSLGAVAVALVIAVFGVFAIMGPVSLPKNGDVIYLQADNTPFKVKPTEAGGKEIAHQDSRFMAYLESGDSENERKEVIKFDDDLPEPPPVKLAETEEKTSLTDEQMLATDLTKLADGNSTKEAKIEKQTVLAQPIKEAVTPAPVNADAKQETVQEEPKQNNVPQPVKRPKKPAKPKEGEGLSQIQLAAFQNEDRAVTAAALLTKKHESRLSGYVLSSQPITKADGSIFWRVLTPVLPASEAAALCRTLKNAGQECIVRKYENTQ